MKTTSFLKGFAIAAAAVFFGSCQQLYIETQPEVEIQMTTDARETYTFSGTNPQPATFSIGSTTPWEITGYEAAEWLSVKPAASALSSLSAEVTLTAVPNETYEQRSVTLTLKGEQARCCRRPHRSEAQHQGHRADRQRKGPGPHR